MIKKNPHAKIAELSQSRAALKQRASETVESFHQRVEEAQRLTTQAITIVEERVAHIQRLNQALTAAAEGRGRAEKALGDLQRRYHATIDALPVLIWEAGPNRVRSYFNKQWLEFTGRSLDQEFGNRWLEGVHPGDRAKYSATYSLAFERRESFTIEYRLRHHSGRFRWVLEHGAPVFGLSGGFVVYVGGCIDIHDRKLAETALARSRQELRSLAARLQAGHEQERAQLAREIHDELSGTLTALKMDLSLLPDRALKSRDEFLDKLDSMSALIDRTLTRVHSLVSELRPVVLDKFGLAAAVEWQVSEFQSRSSVACEVRLPTAKLALDEDRATAIFRIFQEALTNVARHAQATQVVIELKNDNDNIVLNVHDNGKGISVDRIDAPTSIGLLSMRERALSFGGVMEITSGPEGGTLVSVQIPSTKRRRR